MKKQNHRKCYLIEIIAEKIVPLGFLLPKCLWRESFCGISSGMLGQMTLIINELGDN